MVALKAIEKKMKMEGRFFQTNTQKDGVFPKPRLKRLTMEVYPTSRMKKVQMEDLFKLKRIAPYNTQEDEDGGLLKQPLNSQQHSAHKNLQ